MSRRVKEMLKENNELQEQLSDDGKKVLTDIVVYLRGVPVSMYEQERVRRDITQMLIDGEKRGSSAREVIGEDYREFCDNIVGEIPHMTWKKNVCICQGYAACRGRAACDLVFRPAAGSFDRCTVDV